MEEIIDKKPDLKELPLLALICLVAVTCIATVLFYLSVYSRVISFRTGCLGSIAIFALTIVFVNLYSKTKKTKLVLFYYGVIWLITFVFGVSLRNKYENSELAKYGKATKALVFETYYSRSRKYGGRRPKAKIRYNVDGVSFVKDIDNKAQYLQVDDTAKIKYSSKEPGIYRLVAIAKRIIKEQSYEAVSGDTSTSDAVVNAGDRLPQFRGGSQAFYSYLRDRLIYPPVGLVARRAGRVKLSFIVEKDGSIGSVKVEKGMGGGYDAAAIKVLMDSPKWLPAIKHGRAVRVKYHIPITFSL